MDVPGSIQSLILIKNVKILKFLLSFTHVLLK